MSAYEVEGKWKYGTRGEPIYDTKQDALTVGRRNKINELKTQISKIAKQRNK